MIGPYPSFGSTGGATGRCSEWFWPHLLPVWVSSGWWLVAGVLGASIGLVWFGAMADAGTRFGVAAVVTFLPAAVAAALFWCVPETRGREPEDLWPSG